MIQLAEMKQTLPIELHDGKRSTTTQVWEMLTASRDGDLERVKSTAPFPTALFNRLEPFRDLFVQ